MAPATSIVIALLLVPKIGFSWMPGAVVPVVCAMLDDAVAWVGRKRAPAAASAHQDLGHRPVPETAGAGD